MGEMLRTGDVARILGMSRQHIVDLCDHGHIDSVRVGTHRRIPRSEVDRLARRELTREETTTLRLHQALLTKLLTNPDAVISKAKKNLARDLLLHDETPPHIEQWSRILESDLDTIIDALVSPTPAARELRAHSPFVGVLPATVEQRVLQCTERHWPTRPGPPGD